MARTKTPKKDIINQNSIFAIYTLQDLRKMVSEYKTKHDVVNYSKLSKPKLIELLEQKFTIHNGSLYYKLGEIAPRQKTRVARVAPQVNYLENEENIISDDLDNNLLNFDFDDPNYEQANGPVQYVALKRPMPARKVFVDENTEVVRVPAQTENRKRIVMTENRKKLPIPKKQTKKASKQDKSKDIKKKTQNLTLGKVQ